MPIYLESPEYKPGGPDGKGWNRLSLNAHMGKPSAQCALRPRSYPTLFMTRRNTQHAQWGDQYAHCTGHGACEACPVFRTPTTVDIPWEGDDGRVLIRIQPGDFSDRLFAMQDATDGWDSRGVRVAWDALAQSNGWTVGRRHHDEHGDGFWLHRVDEFHLAAANPGPIGSTAAGSAPPG